MGERRKGFEIVEEIRNAEKKKRDRGEKAGLKNESSGVRNRIKSRLLDG